MCGNVLTLVVVIVLCATFLFLLDCVTACQWQVSDDQRIASGIYDAENMLFTDTGRLFVTGGDNIYEIVRSESGNGTFSKRPLFSGPGYFLGIVQRGRYLYTINKQFEFMAAWLAPAANDASTQPELPVFETIYKLVNFSLPNGMAIDLSGNPNFFFIADTAPYGKSIGRIVRLTVLEEEEDQRGDQHQHRMARSSLSIRVTEQVDWLSEGIHHPNGVKAFNNTLYITDTNRIIAIPILPDGTAGRMDVIHSAATYFDDMNIYYPPTTPATTPKKRGSDPIITITARTRTRTRAHSNAYDSVSALLSEGRQPLLMVADYLAGSVVFLTFTSPSALIYETPKFLFQGPSSIVQGNDNNLLGFSSAHIIVTDKGIVNSHIPWGNAVSAVEIVQDACT